MDSIDPARRSVTRYTRVAQTLHWIIAALIVLNIAAALVANSEDDATATAIMTKHLAIGLTVLALSVVRLAWRLTHRPPPFAPTVKPWERALAHFVHWSFYAIIIGLPLLGLAAHSAFSGGKPVSYFGLFKIPAFPMAANRDNGEFWGELHGTVAWTAVGLLVVHVAGALKHHWFDRDGELWRMIPRGESDLSA